MNIKLKLKLIDLCFDLQISIFQVVLFFFEYSLITRSIKVSFKVHRNTVISVLICSKSVFIA